MRLRPKITLAMFAVSAIVCGLITVFLYRFIERQLRADVRDRLHEVAQIGSHTIELGAYRRLVGRLGSVDAAGVTEVEHSADYRTVSSELQIIRSADPELFRYIYILAPTDDPMSPRFVVDADILSGGGPSHFGRRYDASHVPYLVGALRDCAAAHEPDFVYDDEYGLESVSAYIPIADDVTGTPLRDRDGRCLGVLGVDVTMSNVDAVLAKATRLEIAVSVVGILMILAISLVVGNLLTRSVLALSAVVKRFAGKDFAARTPALPRDEIGELGHGFDAMAAVIQAHNDNLEELVRRRTQELMSEQGVRSTKEIQLAEAYAEIRAAQAPGEGRHTGRTLGRFQLGIVIGRGAMGEVYEAAPRDGGGGVVAVKVLGADLLGDDIAVQRFQREAHAIAELDTPHIVKLVDVSPPDAPLPYIVMERLRGTDLNEQIKERPVRELAEVVEIVAAVAAGLDAAHRAGVIHRDLKPANVFAAQAEGGPTTWKILDFGVSKRLGGGGGVQDATLTVDKVIGTPSYMAPEQARGEPVDARTDVYALGVMTYRLLTGRPCVASRDTTTMLLDVVSRMPVRPGSLANLPAAVDVVLAVALAKSPADRPSSAGDFAAALASAATGVIVSDFEARADAILARAPWGAWIGHAATTVDTGLGESIGTTTDVATKR